MDIIHRGFIRGDFEKVRRLCIASVSSKPPRLIKLRKVRHKLTNEQMVYAVSLLCYSVARQSVVRVCRLFSRQSCLEFDTSATHATSTTIRSRTGRSGTILAQRSVGLIWSVVLSYHFQAPQQARGTTPCAQKTAFLFLSELSSNFHQL